MLRKPSECHFLLLHLLIVGLACARIVEVSEVTREKKVSSDESLSGNQYAVRETTTVASLKTVTGGSNSRKLTSPIVEPLPRNGTSVFKPSVHLGEIEQPKPRTSFPFNNVPHVRFEGNLDSNLQYERSQDVLQDTYQGVLDEATRPSRVKFQDDGAVRMPSIHHPFDVQQAVTESTGSQVEDVKHMFIDQMYFQNTERPEMQDTSAIFGKATKSPYLISYHVSNNPGVYQPMSQEMSFEMMKKPDSDDVLVVQQESTYTRKHKFPYPFYQPSNDYMQFVDEPRYSPHLQMRRMSPWKKIIHLIGTILPLGLLLATLTPNVVRINNTTQPSIVLSKLRAADLPIEHKQARSLDDESSAVCEDRSICELILAGGEPESNILQNILWNLATRTSDNVAKRNGLREVFGAVKKKNCTMINC
ncbi:uncharacterized protein [Linepithema humile]|uniref:uncharacterized protein n=1 Tax=Linepithema humile TaxID=83485 RepID=UPI00351E0E13